MRNMPTEKTITFVRSHRNKSMVSLVVTQDQFTFLLRRWHFISICNINRIAYRRQRWWCTTNLLFYFTYWLSQWICTWKVFFWGCMLIYKLRVSCKSLKENENGGRCDKKKLKRGNVSVSLRWPGWVKTNGSGWRISESQYVPFSHFQRRNNMKNARMTSLSCLNR